MTYNVLLMLMNSDSDVPFAFNLIPVLFCNLQTVAGSMKRNNFVVASNFIQGWRALNQLS